MSLHVLALCGGQGRHEAVVQFTEKRAGDFAGKLLALALATRERSPAVELHRQVSDNIWAQPGSPGAAAAAPMPCAWATVNGAVVESVDMLEAALKSCGAESLHTAEDFDHVYPAEAAAGAPVCTPPGPQLLALVFSHRVFSGSHATASWFIF